MLQNSEESSSSECKSYTEWNSFLQHHSNEKRNQTSRRLLAMATWHNMLQGFGNLIFSSSYSQPNGHFQTCVLCSDHNTPIYYRCYISYVDVLFISFQAYYFVLGQSQLTMLGWFQVDSKGTQLYICDTRMRWCFFNHAQSWTHGSYCKALSSFFCALSWLMP